MRSFYTHPRGIRHLGWAQWAALGALLVLALCRPAPAAAAPAGFVVADGPRFAVSTGSGSQPWTPVGYNQYRLTSRPGGYVCDSGSGAVSAGELGDWMDQMRATDANVVRTWFFQSMFDADGAGPGQGSWAAFDRVLDAARARGIRVIPVLVNQWGDCEPSGAKTTAFYNGGYRQDNSYGYSMSFERYASAVAAHYRDDPTIAFWQLANEAEAGGSGCDESAGASALRGFAAQMTADLHAADPNHLVSLGTMGSGQCGASGADYRRINEPVDICEVHDYDSPSSSADDATNAMPGDAWNGFAVRLSQCDDKPIFVGEAGIAADVNGAGHRTGSVTASTLAARADMLRAKLGAQLGAGFDGYLVWERIRTPSTSSFNGPGTEGYGIGPGDPAEDVIRDFATPGDLGGAWHPASGPYAEAVAATSGVESYWRLGEPAGIEAAMPSVGNASGSYEDAVGRGSGLISGDPDSAALFSGARAAVAFGDRADFPGRRPFSLEAWVAPAKAAKRVGGPLVSKLQRHWGGYSLATTSSGKLEFELARRSRVATLRGPKLAAGTRHHVVASYDGRRLRLCVDGDCNWSRRAKVRLCDTAAALEVGRAGRTSFAGTIDEVAIYSVALDQATVAAHAALGE